MRILIRRAGFTNKGAEAMLRVTQKQLRERIPNAEFFVSRETVQGPHIERAKKMDFQIAEDMQYRSIAVRVVDRVKRIVGANHQLTSFDPVVRRLDAIMDASGYAYGGNWKLSYPQHTAIITASCLRHNVPYVFLPQTWGPFNDPATAYIYKAMLAGTLYYSRDNDSSLHLSKLLEKELTTIPLVPDIAFTFMKSKACQASSQDFSYLFDATYKSVAVTPSRKIYSDLKARSSEDAQEYIRLFATVCRHLRAMKFQVVLVPHEIDWKPTLDDALLCDIIGSAATEESCDVRGIHSASQIEDAAQLKLLISSCIAVIGSRFHSLVAGLSLGKPVVAIGWSHKYQELLRPFGLADRSFAVENIVGAESWYRFTQEILSAVSKTVESSDDTAKIVSVADSHKKAVNNMFDEIAENLCTSYSKNQRKK